jgi:ribosome maturation factor RimP
MKVKLNISVGINGKSHNKGDVVEVNKDMAAALILSNKGVEVKAKAEAKKKK